MPAPLGFPSVDLSVPMSEELQSIVSSPGNRLLAVYGTTPITLGNDPIFHVQTAEVSEEIVYSIEQFKEVTTSLGSLLGEPASQGEIQNGESQSLGIYDQGEHHLSFAVLGRPPAAREDEEGLVSYVAASINNVHGKVINLYCMVAAEPESNRALAREQLATWQQAVLGSNPAAQLGTGSSTVSFMKRGALVGAVVGLLWPIIGMFVGKGKKA